MHTLTSLHQWQKLNMNHVPSQVNDLFKAQKRDSNHCPYITLNMKRDIQKWADRFRLLRAQAEPLFTI